MSEKIDYFAMVEEAWALSDAARAYVKEAKEAGRQVGRWAFRGSWTRFSFRPARWTFPSANNTRTIRQRSI